jgi:hypothetical protein
MNCKTCEDSIYYDKRYDEWYMRIENGNWDYRNDGFDFTDIEINFCPICGKDYRVTNNSKEE